MEEARIGSVGQDTQLGSRDQSERDRLRHGATAVIGPMKAHGAQMLRHLIDGEYAPRPDAVLLEEGEQARVLLRLLGDAQDRHLAAGARLGEAEARGSLGGLP